MIHIKISINVKRCSKCMQILSKNDFYKRTQSKDGLNSWCKNCAKKNIKQDYLAHRKERLAYLKQYRKENRNIFSEIYYKKHTTTKCRRCKKEMNRSLYSKSTKLCDICIASSEKPCDTCKKWLLKELFWKDSYRIDGYDKKCKECKRRYRSTKRFKKMHSKTHTVYALKRRREDINFKLQCNIRQRLKQAIKNNSKAGSAVKDLGCSIEEFKNYIASKFQEGMSWENWGYKGWHLDHIIPLASFDLTNREQFLKACHYMNYQPLWAADNLIKGSKIK